MIYGAAKRKENKAVKMVIMIVAALSALFILTAVTLFLINYFSHPFSNTTWSRATEIINANGNRVTREETITFGENNTFVIQRGNVVTEPATSYYYTGTYKVRGNSIILTHDDGRKEKVKYSSNGTVATLTYSSNSRMNQLANGVHTYTKKAN